MGFFSSSSLSTTFLPIGWTTLYTRGVLLLCREELRTIQHTWKLLLFLCVSFFRGAVDFTFERWGKKTNQLDIDYIVLVVVVRSGNGNIARANVGAMCPAAMAALEK